MLPSTVHVPDHFCENAVGTYIYIYLNNRCLPACQPTARCYHTSNTSSTLYLEHVLPKTSVQANPIPEKPLVVTPAKTVLSNPLFICTKEASRKLVCLLISLVSRHIRVLFIVFCTCSGPRNLGCSEPTIFF